MMRHLETLKRDDSEQGSAGSGGVRTHWVGSLGCFTHVPAVEGSYTCISK